MKRKEIIYKGLQNTPVYIEDTTLNSPDYFQITEFPAQFTAGKNAFKFKGNPDVFVYGSDLQIEIIDFNGEPIYYEVVDYLTDDGSIIVAVYVYEDTPSGACTVAMIGQSANVPEEWQGRTNIKWTRQSTVNAMSPNVTEIVFDVLPEVTVTEQVGVHLDRVFANGQFPTYTAGTVKYLSLNETPALELTGGKFTADMVGGTITVSTPQNPTPAPNYTLSTTAYTTTIKKILSDSLALLDTEYTVLHSASMTTHTYKNFDASSYSISYEATPTYIATQNSESYAVIEIKGLQPATGDVSRIKTFMNNNGTVGTWELINDIELTETDVFVASTASLYPDQNIGKFTSQGVIDTYWEAYTYVGKTEKTAPTMTWTTASLNNAMQVTGTTDISASDAVYVTQIKSTYAATFVERGDYKVTIDAIGTSTNSLRPKLSIYLSGSAFNFDSTDTFNQTLPVILGRRVGEIELDSNNQRLEDYVFNFQADRTGTATLLLVIENGTWQFSDVRTTTDNDTGYTPNYTRIRSLVPTAHKSSNQLSFKTEYYNVAGERSKQISYINDKSWTGGNRYIDGDYSMITGSLYVADTLGSGIAITGQKNTGYVRSLGYTGFDAGNPGFLIWSGSALPGTTSKGAAYSGVGIELYANTASYLRYSTSDSELDVRTNKFFLGSSNQYISGSNGNIEISSSNFSLDRNGNVTMSGSINAVAGAIGSIDLNGIAGSINGGAAFIDTFNGDALDTNLWYDNSSNAGEKSVIVNGALRLQNDDAAWDYAVIGRKSFNRANTPAFIWHFKVLETSTSLPNQPRMMVGVTDKTGSSNYGDNVHAIYFSQNSILIYEGFTNRGTISSNTVAVGDTYRVELYPKSPASASYIIYKNENYTTPFLSSSFGVSNSASLYPGIWTLPTSSTMEFYSVYAYDSAATGAFDIKGGGSFGFINNTGNKVLFTQGGFALASANVGINGSSVRIGDSFKFDGSNLTISGSGTKISTPSFFLGTSGSQYISGSNGSLEIASTNFRLDRAGNVTASNAEFRGVNLADSYQFRVIEISNPVADPHVSLYTTGSKTYMCLNLTGSYDPAFESGSSPAMFVKCTWPYAYYPIGAIKIHPDSWSTGSRYRRYGGIVILESQDQSTAYNNYVWIARGASNPNLPDAEIRGAGEFFSLAYSNSVYSYDGKSYDGTVIPLNASQNPSDLSITSNRCMLIQSAENWTIHSFTSYDYIDVQWPKLNINDATLTGTIDGYPTSAILKVATLRPGYIQPTGSNTIYLVEPDIPNNPGFRFQFISQSAAVLGNIEFDSNYNLNIGTTLAKSFSLKTNDTDRLTISRSGEIGIGGSITKLSGSLFAGVTPKMEIITGTTTSAYSESIVIRHSGQTNTAVTRSLGLLLKLSNENMPNESPKMGGMMLRSTSTFANSPSLHFVTGDAERMTISNSGNIGIGTLSPTAQLHIVQDAVATAFRIDDDVNDTTPFIVDDTGEVGIGTASPNTKLTVSASGADGINLGTDLTAPKQSARLFFSNADAGQAVVILNTSGSMRFHTGATAGNNTGTIRMSLSGSNLGIGTTAPAAMLHITQTASFDSFRVDDASGDTSPLIIDQNGNLAIGKTTATAKLDASGSAYVTGSMRVTGSLRVAGNVTISSGSLTMPNRPAFRVSGSSVSSISSVTTISGSHGIVIDYNQGGHYNNTNGTFTAPISGLYHVYLNCRTNSASTAQVIIYKNTTTAQLMWESSINLGHFGVSGVLYLAANDTLIARVMVGTIQFDSNDSWGAAYIG